MGKRMPRLLVVLCCFAGSMVAIRGVSLGVSPFIEDEGVGL